MNVGIVGGTGAFGRGLAMRWLLAGHRVWIGSRTLEKAEETVQTIASVLREKGWTVAERLSPTGRQRGLTVHGKGGVEPVLNPEAAAAGEVVVFALPAGVDEAFWRHLAAQLRGKIVLDCGVDLDPHDPTRVAPRVLTPGGSHGQRLQRALGPEVKVVAGFHTIGAAKLLDVASSLDADALLAGDDEGAKKTVASLATDIGLRPVDVGGLERGAVLEQLTAMLIGLNRRYKRKAVGIRLTGL